MVSFRAVLEKVSHGGCYVCVPERVAAAASVAYGDRVRGTIRGAGYRSALMKYSGVFHLGIPRATLEAAGARLGDRVQVSIEPDPDPLPGDEVPADLARALDAVPAARRAFEKLSPAHRREHVKHVLEARRPETRERRIAATVKALADLPRSG
jgi:hypothetical protein